WPRSGRSRRARLPGRLRVRSPPSDFPSHLLFEFRDRTRPRRSSGRELPEGSEQTNAFRGMDRFITSGLCEVTETGTLGGARQYIDAQRTLGTSGSFVESVAF